MLRNLGIAAALGLLGLPALASAQSNVSPAPTGPYVPPATTWAREPAPSPYRVDITPATSGVANPYAQFSLYPLRSTPPTLMTSINYPGVYGAYYIGAAPSAYVPGLSVSGMTLRPTWTTIPPAWAYPPAIPPVAPAVLPTATAARQVVADESPARATITIFTPEQASVWVQDEALPGTGTEHVYTTPPLPRNQLFSYEVRAMWSQDGQPMSDVRKVIVRAGSEHRIGFEKKPAIIADRLNER